jgi:hypothetical protein
VTSIAQDILDHGLGDAPRSYLGGPRGKFLQMAMALTQMALDPEEQHIEVGPFKVPYRAERYQFEGLDPAGDVHEHILAGNLTDDLVFASAHMPVNLAWIEWTSLRELKGTDKEKYKVPLAVLLDAHSELNHSLDTVMGIPSPVDNSIYGVIYARHHRAPDRVMPVMVFTVLGGFNMQQEVEVVWSWHETEARRLGYSEKECVDTQRSLLMEIAELLFLLNTPRVSETKTPTISPKLQRARLRRRKLPLLEFKRVKVLLGAPSIRYPKGAPHIPGETREERHRRLHQVTGHFRHYLQGRDKPHVAWVPPHWRGDAQLGVVMHDRRVIKPERPSP